jgi:hypothetical protein
MLTKNLHLVGGFAASAVIRDQVATVKSVFGLLTNSVANTVTSLEGFNGAGPNSGKPGHPRQMATVGDRDFSGSAGCFHVLHGDYDTMFKWLQTSAYPEYTATSLASDR